ncbi:unnamed protein product [Mortierella alpina]
MMSQVQAQERSFPEPCTIKCALASLAQVEGDEKVVKFARCVDDIALEMGYLPYLPVAKRYKVCESEARNSLRTEDLSKYDARVEQCNTRCNFFAT